MSDDERLRAAGIAFAVALGEFVAAEEKCMDRSLYPDANERWMIAMSNPINVILKAARSRFESMGMPPDDARQRAVEMVAYAVGEDSFFRPASDGGPS